MSALEITVCPSCSSDRIAKVCRDWSGQFEGRSYTVPSLEFYECPACGEKVYDRDAMRRIQEHSPAFTGVRTLPEMARIKGESRDAMPVFLVN